MESNIYKKLQKMRDALQKEQIHSFSDLITAVNKKAKSYRVLPLYCFYGDMATLSIVDLDNIATVIKFQIPVGLVEKRKLKERLYSMAFDVEINNEGISYRQYLKLTERMKELNVDEKKILDRYHIESMADITEDIYSGCMRILHHMSVQEKDKRQRS